MIELLDLATSYRINALLYLLMSLTTWLVLGRPTLWPVRVWCAAGVLAGVSVWLITLRGAIDDVWTYLVAQPMLLASYRTYAQSMRMDLARPWPWRALAAVVLAYGLVLVIGFEHRQTPAMAVLVRVCNSAALLALTLSALALVRHERSRNAVFMVAGFGLFTLAMLVNAVLTWWGQAVLHAMQQWTISHVMGLVSLLTILMAYMGYLGLALDRARVANLPLRQAQWQAQQWRAQAQALTLLDRQRTLAVLANSLGHDILQPLTAARLNVQLSRRMVASTGAEPSAVRQVLAQTVEGLRQSADRVGRIRNFLQPRPQAHERLLLQAVVEDVHKLLRQELMYRRIDLQLVLPAQDVVVQAQALPMTQALLQVLRNAMQAVQGQPTAQSRIRVTLQASASEACIEVSDSGPGLPEHLRAQPLADTQPSVNGLGGLGLYMTRSILQTFDGDLALGTDPVGGGACVRLVLPLAAPQQT